MFRGLKLSPTVIPVPSSFVFHPANSYPLLYDSSASGVSTPVLELVDVTLLSAMTSSVPVTYLSLNFSDFHCAYSVTSSPSLYVSGSLHSCPRSNILSVSSSSIPFILVHQPSSLYPGFVILSVSSSGILKLSPNVHSILSGAVPSPPIPRSNTTVYFIGLHCAYKVITALSSVLRLVTIWLFVYAVPLPSRSVFHPVNTYPLCSKPQFPSFFATSYVNFIGSLYPSTLSGSSVFESKTTVYVIGCHFAYSVTSPSVSLRFTTLSVVLYWTAPSFSVDHPLSTYPVL